MNGGYVVCSCVWRCSRSLWIVRYVTSINWLLQWFTGDLLAEIETDKATMGFETPEEGYLAKILVQAGEKDIPIGKLVCIIVENESDVAAFADFKDSSGWNKREIFGVCSYYKYCAFVIVCLGAPAAQPAAAAAPAPTAAAPPVVAPPPIVAAPAAPRPLTAVEQRGPRVYASPMAKRLAEAQQLRLEGHGSGVFGSITSKDLDQLGAAAASAGAAAAPSVPAGAAYVDIPVSNTRSIIAKRLLESKVTIPHYYLTVEVNVDQVGHSANRTGRYMNVFHSNNINLFLCSSQRSAASSTRSSRRKASNCRSMTLLLRHAHSHPKKYRKPTHRGTEASFASEYPSNFHYKQHLASNEHVIMWVFDHSRYDAVDCSVAVATDKGLITPIVPSADRKGLVDINQTIKTLAGKAREGKLQPHEFQGGTITVSNLGMFGKCINLAILATDHRYLILSL